MAVRTPRRALLAMAAGSTALALGLAGCAAGPTDDGAVELSLLVDNSEQSVIPAEALIEAFEAANPGITIELETRPQGAEGDNVVKTRLATGEMTDLFLYNSGSLFQALNPDATVLPISDDPMLDNVIDSFEAAVSTPNGVYGVPFGNAVGGGIFYNIGIYDELGLEVPTTWDDFTANNEAIVEAGYAGVIQTYADTWTSQLFLLGDFYNVLAVDPEWADAYTANERKYATDENAIKGFERLQEVFESGFLNEDFASATYDDGLRKVATGEGAHYPMLTFAVGPMVENFPEAQEGVGFFGIPGDGPNGLTTWMPGGLYAAATTEHPEEAKLFMAFLASVEGCDIQIEAIGAAGPFLVEGCSLPDDVARSIADMLPYFESSESSAPALEFLSPIKGPALEQITVEVGSGIRSAADGAALYDEDVIKQAQQLGLEGW